jgi:hypothetical protein
MFRAFSHPLSGAQWLQWQPMILLYDKKVKPEAATAVIELLIMGEKRPKHVEL